MLGRKHYYTSDHPERTLVHVYLALLGTLCSYGLYWVSKKYTIEIPWWLDAPAVMGCYGILYWAFSTALWKMNWLKAIGIIKTPDWNGEYTGKLKTSFDDFSKEIDFTIKICQDWDKILLLTSINTSSSSTQTASFLIKDCVSPALVYTYQSNPSADALSSMNIHIGVGEITMEQGGVLKGEYFTGRGRNTWGTFHLVRSK